jgi:hypothetical protein
MAQPKFCVLLSSRSKEANMNEGKLRECARFDSQNKRECARTYSIGLWMYALFNLGIKLSWTILLQYYSIDYRSFKCSKNFLERVLSLTIKKKHEFQDLIWGQFNVIFLLQRKK